MQAARTVGALFLGLGLATSVWAQAPKPDELRQQIKSLEKQLEQSEHTAKKFSHVTQIGGSQLIERRDEQIVRLYDLSDLFAVAPPYVAERFEGLGAARSDLFTRPTPAQRGTSGGMMGGMGGGFFSLPNSVRPPAEQGVLPQRNETPRSPGVSTTMDGLVDAIQTSIAPTTWDQVGGNGSIAQLGNALLISTTKQNHDQIESLLQLFRQRWGTLRTISVRAWWLWLDADQAQQLLVGAPADDEQDTLRAFGVVDSKRWQDLLANQDNPPAQTGYRAAITCYNGQTVSTQNAKQTLVVTAVQPVVSKEQVSYQAVSTVIQEGVALEVTPASNTSGKLVVLDVHSRVNRLLPAAKAAPLPADLPAEAEHVAAAIGQPQLATQQLSTTLRVPVDQIMLVGGMTFNEATEGNRPNLFLFVKVSVQELRDDREPQAQLPAPAGANEAE